MTQVSENIKNDTNEELQIITFKVGKEEFSVSIFDVQEIIRMCEITSIPNSPPFVEGVINLRGKVIPVINSRKRFGLPLIENTDASRIIVVDSDGKIVGLIVDSVTEVLQLDRSTIEPPPDIVGGVDSNYIDGVGKYDDKIIILLNLVKLLSFTEEDRLNEIAAAAAAEAAAASAE